jgi:hypothetical protein
VIEIFSYHFFSLTKGFGFLLKASIPKIRAVNFDTNRENNTNTT